MAGILVVPFLKMGITGVDFHFISRVLKTGAGNLGILIAQPFFVRLESRWRCMRELLGFEIPATNQSCGYDLEKSDWVAPYGKGLVADMIFNLKRRYANVNDFEVNLDATFSNPLDGIQEIEPPAVGLYSVFKWPREVLDSGYKTGINSSFSHLPNSGRKQHAEPSK